jgi:hypothetical protein
MRPTSRAKAIRRLVKARKNTTINTKTIGTKFTIGNNPVKKNTNCCLKVRSRRHGKPGLLESVAKQDGRGLERSGSM